MLLNGSAQQCSKRSELLSWTVCRVVQCVEHSVLFELRIKIKGGLDIIRTIQGVGEEDISDLSFFWSEEPFSNFSNA